MEKKDIREILEKVSSGEYTPEEEVIAKRWLLQLHQHDELKLSAAQLSASRQKVWDSLQIHSRQHLPKTIRLWPRMAIAVAIATIIFSGGLFFYSSRQAEQVKTAYANDIAPGKVGATLTLANGKKIRLADAVNGELATQAGVKVSKSEDGQLIYEIKKSDDTGNGGMNTLSTAMGETYQLRLPDGSLVWLNAASSLTYHAALNDDGRRVVGLSGEGYFEVAKDPAHPFIVKTNKQEIEVLGTHFNINSYADEPAVRTTLLEGSIKILANGSQRMLKPGFEALNTGSGIKINKVNAEDAVDWKQGMFTFQDEPLESIMRRVARWYNVEVVYGSGVDKNELYGGGVSRYDHVSKVLEALQFTGDLQFKIEGRRITIMK